MAHGDRPRPPAANEAKAFAQRLCSAVQANKVKVVKDQVDEKLSEFGPDYKLPEDHVENALNLACDQGHHQVAQILVEHGARLDTEDEDGNTPLHRAAKEGRWTIAELLINTMKQRSQGDDKLVKEYVTRSNAKGETAFHVFAQSTKKRFAKSSVPAIVSTFVDAGVDAEARDEKGCTAAHYACEYGSVAFLEKLYSIKKASQQDAGWMGIQTFAEGNRGGKATCLHVAARNAQTEVVRWLLSRMHKADLAIKNARGWTARRVASKLPVARKRFEVMFEFLSQEYYWVELSELLLWNTEKLKDHQERYCFRVNNRAGPSFLLYKLVKEETIGPQVVDLFLQGFFDDSQNDILRTRQPCCVWEMIDRPGLDQSTIPEASRDEYLAIVMPVFLVQEWSHLQRWRKEPDGGLRHNTFSRHPARRTDRKRPRPMANSEHDPEDFDIYMPLTLDEYCNQKLPQESLDERNSLQVLHWTTALNQNEHWTRLEDTRIGKPEDKALLLMVGQAWIWNIGSTLITSTVSFDKKHFGDKNSLNVPKYAKDENVNIHPTSSNGDNSKRYRSIGIILSNLIASFGHKPDNRQGWTLPLAVYEQAITLVSKRVNDYARRTGVGTISIPQERTYLLLIDDVQEELNMIGRVLNQQERVFDDFVSHACPSQFWDPVNERAKMPRDYHTKFRSEERDEWDEWSTILQAKPQIAMFRRRILELNEDAERVKQSITAQLDLKLKGASIRESHATALMSTAVFGFSVVTIIFAPLSFVTALFALPIDQLQKNQADNPYSTFSKMYTTSYVGK
ncbi:hypothetical protein M409DRAFT_49571 [Zasmidium cellare ATCC 36951]|uniref:Uncharacterized protein n=1 Tax=Zasmidium cellare ATCC 36951 TaxID=1080233 RepID=A0A6A6D5Y6_ZASCE|nr:uncharacterized protein M409DRAFT_49571 [Zasmidium cellare ATCC 36951]KAF2173076.1 hypothetical protein M409DRAFT_49571 [Zasmidium cellare ATCC 36951]